jgi:NAD dependent epimerase/dehydratase family enzyme
MTAPNPVTNANFTRALGKALHRPTILPVPRMALELIFGEMADETLLASQRALPRVLLSSGFVFESPTIDEALARVLD